LNLHLETIQILPATRTCLRLVPMNLRSMTAADFSPRMDCGCFRGRRRYDEPSWNGCLTTRDLDFFFLSRRPARGGDFQATRSTLRSSLCRARTTCCAGKHTTAKSIQHAVSKSPALMPGVSTT